MTPCHLLPTTHPPSTIDYLPPLPTTHPPSNIDSLPPASCDARRSLAAVYFLARRPQRSNQPLTRTPSASRDDISPSRDAISPPRDTISPPRDGAPPRDRAPTLRASSDSIAFHLSPFSCRSPYARRVRSPSPSSSHPHPVVVSAQAPRAPVQRAHAATACFTRAPARHRCSPLLP